MCCLHKAARPLNPPTRLFKLCPLFCCAVLSCSNAHAKKPNFNVNGGFVEYTSNFLCNCAAQQIQQIPEQCEALHHCSRPSAWTEVLSLISATVLASEYRQVYCSCDVTCAYPEPVCGTPIRHGHCSQHSVQGACTEVDPECCAGPCNKSSRPSYCSTQVAARCLVVDGADCCSLLAPALPWHHHAAAAAAAAAAAVVDLCRRFKDQLLTPQVARLGITPLLAALQRLTPGKQHLTPLHADVLQL